jgi:predicted phosphoribosyltransferase
VDWPARFGHRLLLLETFVDTERGRGPQKVIVAVPVAAAETVDKLKSDVDDLVVLYIPEWFGAVGAFYQRFDQVVMRKLWR